MRTARQLSIALVGILHTLTATARAGTVARAALPFTGMNRRILVNYLTK